MSKRKLLITEKLDKDLLKQIKAIIPNWEIWAEDEPALLAEYASKAEIIAGWRRELEPLALSEASSLRWIQSWSAGVDSMPLNRLAENDVQLTSANGVHAFPITETIFGLMLAHTRKIAAYVKNQQKKRWHNAGISLELHQKTIGLIGVGAIGRETAKIAKAFGMKTLGIRHSGKPTEYVDEMYTLDEIEAVLPRCDYVVIILPLTPETKHLFNQALFRRMKSSAFIVNVGRGELVQEADLIQALNKGEIAGAGLDVFESEPYRETVHYGTWITSLLLPIQPGQQNIIISESLKRFLSRIYNRILIAGNSRSMLSILRKGIEFLLIIRSPLIHT